MTVEKFNQTYCNRFRLVFTCGANQTGSFILLNSVTNGILKIMTGQPIADVPYLSDVPQDIMSMV